MARFTAWAPGRVNLIGEHTDYSGGLVLPAAVQLGIAVSVDGIADRVMLSSVAFGDGEPFAPDGRGPLVHGWARFAQAVARELDELGRPPVGLTATIASDLPTGVGLSSSAALEIGIALALCTVARFDLEPFALAQACQRAELRAVGVPCGILDQAACVLGAKDRAILLNCSTCAYERVTVPSEAALLVVDSGEPRRLEDSPYAQRRAELETAMSRLGATNSTEVAKADLAGLDTLSRRRLRHVVTENERVVTFATALSSHDLEAAGELMLESHRSLREDYDVSTSRLDDLVRLAKQEGAHGARLTGGGFGGAIVALVDRDGAEEIRAAIVRAHGGAANAMILRPSNGARVESANGSPL